MATRALTNSLSSELSRALQDALAVESFQVTTSLLDPNQQSARLDPAARVTILKRVGNRVYITFSRIAVVIDAGPGHRARDRSDRSALLDPVA